MLKQSFYAFKLIQPLDSTSIQQVSFKRVANGFDIALQQNRMDVEVNVEAVCSGLKRPPLRHDKVVAYRRDQQNKRNTVLIN